MDSSNRSLPRPSQVKQDQTGLDRSVRSTLDFGAKGLKVSRSQGPKVTGGDGGDEGDGSTGVRDEGECDL